MYLEQCLAHRKCLVLAVIYCFLITISSSSRSSTRNAAVMAVVCSGEKGLEAKLGKQHWG